MNALEGKYLCLCEISINLNKLLAVLLLHVYLFIRFFSRNLLSLVYLFLPFFILMLLLYIHNWSLQLFSRNNDLASHTNYVVCVNFLQFYTCSLKSTQKDRFLRGFFCQFFWTLRVFARNLVRRSRQ